MVKMKFLRWMPWVAAACQAANAQQAPTVAIGSYFTNVAGSVITRANNTAAYTSPATVCATTATVLCVPGTIQIASANNQAEFINRVTLMKSGITTTNASFTIWFFSAAPVTTVPNQFDNTAYSGPRSADLPNYLGNAACATPLATSDTTAGVWYECTLSNPNTAGALVEVPLSNTRTINYLITATANYTGVALETFTPYVSGFY